MQKQLLIACAITLCLAAGVLGAYATPYSEASAAGTWVCGGNGYALVKNQNGVASWVPSSFVGWYTLGGGKFVSVKETDNSAGRACNNVLGQGPNSYSVTSDGTVSFILTEMAAGSNPSQCPVNATAHSTGVFQNPTSLYAVLTDSDASGWFICSKRSGK
jgi:hypothetical protein